MNTASICANLFIQLENNTPALNCTLSLSIWYRPNLITPFCYSTCEGIDFSNQDINKSIINLNVTGTYCTTPPLANIKVFNFEISCKFSCTSPLVTKWQNQTPSAYDKPLAGILAYRANINSCVDNIFSNSSNGIIGYTSNLILRGNQFFDIYPTGNNYNDRTTGLFNLVFNGSGIYANGGRSNAMLHHQGWGKYGNVSFDNCNWGVFADRINLESNNNRMTNMLTGYRITAGQGKDMRIRLNNVQSNSDGIQLYVNDGCNALIVNQNDVTFGSVSGNTAIGIVQRDANVKVASPNVHIRNNKIYYQVGATNARIGILSNAANSTEIAKNKLYLSNAGINTYGISLDGSEANNVSCNSVYGVGTTGTGQHAAIRMFVGDYHRVGCNSLNSMENGLFIQSPMPNISIKGNDLVSNKNGMRFGILSGSAKVIKDWDDGNRFLGNTLDAWNEYFQWDFITNGVQPPKTKVDLSGNCMPASQLPNNPSWFQSALGTNWTCTTDNPIYCNNYPDNCDDCRTNQDDEIASGEFENGAYTNESLWLLSKQLFAKLVANDTLRNDSLLEAFYQSHVNTALANLVAVEGNTSQLTMSDSLVTWMLAHFRDSILATNNAASLGLASVNNNLLDTAAIDSLIQLITVLQLRIAALMDDAENIQTGVEATDATVADNIYSDNEAIIAGNTIEDYEKAYNAIYLNTVAKHNYVINSYQKHVLHTIANLCPVAFGEVVFKARTLYSMLEAKAEYNDLSACNAIGIQIRKGKKNVIDTKNIRMYPNPTADKVTIEMNNINELNGSIVIRNMYGQIVLQKMLNDKNNFEFSTGNFAPGVYNVEILNNTQKLFGENLIIIRR